MWYLHAEREGQTSQHFEDPDRNVLLAQMTVLEAGGWKCWLFDEAEQSAMAHLTRKLIEQHPDLYSA